MSEIEKIKRYTDCTRADLGNYTLRMDELRAISQMESVFDAVALAFNYGRAKGYRAAKNGK